MHILWRLSGKWYQLQEMKVTEMYKIITFYAERETNLDARGPLSTLFKETEKIQSILSEEECRRKSDMK